MKFPHLPKEQREVILLSLSELYDKGVSIELNDLIYGKFENGYIVVYCNYDLDVFLTSRLPKNQSDNKSEFVLLECLGYRNNKTEKSEIIEKIFEKAGKRID